MTVTIKHSKTNAISDWTQAQLDEQIELGNFAPGTTLADIVLPSDWNNDHTLTGLGTMAEQNANSVAITGGTINNTTIGATTATTGRFTSVTTPSVTATTLDLALNSVGTGTINLSSGNGIAFRALDNGATGNSWAAYGSTVSPVLEASGSSTNVNGIVRTKGTGILAFRTNTIDEQLRVSHTTSAVNYVQVTGAATTGFPAISAQGSDTNIGITYAAKGSSRHVFTTGNGTQFRINDATSSVNTLETTGAATGLATRLYSQGSDTNISLALLSKGTGAIDLAAGSSGVNVSNGGTVTAITVTNAGATAYSSIPTATVSVPTTAGGVQATTTVAMRASTGATTLGSGGTGYTAGNVLTIVGGVFSTAIQITVSTVSAGVITAFTVSQAGSGYTTLPTNPASVTGGSGSGATFNLAWFVNTISLATAGSGYIEQPTVTFSGGGGSGAAAYATVGSMPIIRSLAGSAASTDSLSFYTPAGESVRIKDQGVTSNGYVQLQGSSATSNGSYVSSTTGSLYLSCASTNAIGFFTGGQGTTRQFNITHTASAVNYVQVTGSTTGNVAVISAQGSDTNIPLAINSKGASAVRFAAQNTDFPIINGGTGTVSLSASGASANVDLALGSKGTGVIAFGTHTATADVAISGFITIKDAGGTLRKLAVIT